MRISRSVAKRIDRLAVRAHRFHRYAHHPLCGAYRAELVQLGRRGRVCRGCLYTALGAVVGAAAGAVQPLTAGVWLVGLAAGAALALLGCRLMIGRWRAGVGERARPSKLWTRWLPAAAALWALVLGLRLHDASGFVLSAAALAACAGYYASYRRRGPDRTPCTTCPERTRAVICSGFAPIVRRERALQRVAAKLISA